MFETATRHAMEFVEANIAFAEPIVFLLGFGESIVFVSLFIPSTILFLGIGGVHSAAGGEFLPMWIAASTGAFLGDLASFAVGRHFRNDVHRIWPLSKNRRWIAFARRYVKHWGMSGIVVSKFTGMLRPIVPVMAGSLRMTWPRFLIASAISCLIWSGAFLGPGYGIMWFLS